MGNKRGQYKKTLGRTGTYYERMVKPFRVSKQRPTKYKHSVSYLEKSGTYYDRVIKSSPAKLASYRKHHLKEKYGITPEQYDDMFQKQGGRCAICAKHNTDLVRPLAVDHCHVSGVVRGLLCSLCNPLLGYAQDDVKILEKSIRYLRSFPPPA